MEPEKFMAENTVGMIIAIIVALIGGTLWLGVYLYINIPKWIDRLFDKIDKTL